MLFIDTRIILKQLAGCLKRNTVTPGNDNRKRTLIRCAKIIPSKTPKETFQDPKEQTIQ